MDDVLQQFGDKRNAERTSIVGSKVGVSVCVFVSARCLPAFYP